MKIQIALGIAIAAIIVTSIAIANNNPKAYESMQSMHESHHSGNGGMMDMHNMMNGNWEEMHTQCESLMAEDVHEQCEAMMKTNGCPMM